MTTALPSRIVCLTEEPTEVLYALGEEHRIVGISRFTVRPPAAKRAKPRVSAFTSADIEAILALKPDLAIGFSDMQADIARDLIRSGVEVWISNHRTVDGIIGYVRRLGALVGASGPADDYANELRERVAAIRSEASALTRRPRVYFEEWDDPMISGIGWVSELIDIAGGRDIFPGKAAMSLAKDRIVQDSAQVPLHSPDIIFASWCGKKFQPQKLKARLGWAKIPAIATGQVHEIDSSIILQPGPAALTDGLAEIHRHIARWANGAGFQDSGATS